MLGSRPYRDCRDHKAPVVQRKGNGSLDFRGADCYLFAFRASAAASAARRTAASASDRASSLSLAAVRALLMVFGARFSTRAISPRGRPEAKSSRVRLSNAVSVHDGAELCTSLDRGAT